MKTPSENHSSLIPVKIFLIRHGQTDWNLQRRLQGHTDVPLNETGRIQARALKKILAGFSIEAFFSSDLVRAKETAELAKAHAKIPVLEIPGLREAALGAAEGLHFEELQLRFPDAYERWLGTDSQQDDFAFPGGESKSQHRERLKKALEEIFLDHAYKEVAIVTHGGAMRRVLEFSKSFAEPRIRTLNTSVFELTYFRATKEFHYSKKIYSPG